MITLSYPSTAPYSQSITIRNPELGDSEQIDIKTQVQQNMAGAFYTHKKTPIAVKRMLTFRTLTLTEKEALKSFYKNALGNSVRYVDYNGVVRFVRIVSESLVITTIKDDCSYDATLELMEG